jgi:predicted DNA-binding transcriptional regulator AlpA
MTLITDMDSVRVLTRTQTIRALGLSEKTFKRMERAGETPPKTRLSPGRIGYRVKHIHEWLDKRSEVAA